MSAVSGSSLVIVRTGTANVASVLAALRRAEPTVDPIVSNDRSVVAQAQRLVLPGVGTFRAAMDELRAADLIDTLRERLAAGRPTLCICLGLQLLLNGSEESADVAGLGVAAGIARRFPPTVRVPHMGFNQVDPGRTKSLFVEPGAAYFANSYRLIEPPPGWGCSWTDYGGRFVCAMERDGVLACQFHPELSGAWGAALLRRWLGCAVHSRGAN